MPFLDTTYKRKSAVMTTIVGLVLILLLFFFGLTYYDPPKEFGIAVNFGTSDVGSGNRQPREALKPLQQEQPEQQEDMKEYDLSV